MPVRFLSCVLCRAFEKRLHSVVYHLESLRQRVLRFCRGLDIENLIKTPLIYSVSYFNLEGLSALFEGLRPPKSPSDDGAECTS